MTDYQRTITRETTMTDPTVPVTTPTRVVPSEPVAATSVRTTERAHVDAGPSGPSVIARAVIFLFGILQVALILRIIGNPGGAAPHNIDPDPRFADASKGSTQFLDDLGDDYLDFLDHVRNAAGQHLHRPGGGAPEPHDDLLNACVHPTAGGGGGCRTGR